MTVTRRALRFETLDDAVRDAEHLLLGYERAGNWTLSQVCDHLTCWLTYPVDGFPKSPLPIAVMLWVLKKTIGRNRLEEYLRTQSFPTGKPTIPQSVPPAGDDAAAVARFRVAAERLMKYDGPIQPSPLFGPMTQDVLLKLQCVHAAHHLSFLVPKT